MCVFQCFVRVFFCYFYVRIRRTIWKSMFPPKVDRISQRNSCIVDITRSSISLASRLSHEEKKTIAPKRELLIWDKPALLFSSPI